MVEYPARRFYILLMLVYGVRAVRFLFVKAFLLMGSFLYSVEKVYICCYKSFMMLTRTQWSNRYNAIYNQVPYILVHVTQCCLNCIYYEFAYSETHNNQVYWIWCLASRYRIYKNGTAFYLCEKRFYEYRKEKIVKISILCNHLSCGESVDG